MKVLLILIGSFVSYSLMMKGIKLIKDGFRNNKNT